MLSIFLLLAQLWRFLCGFTTLNLAQEKLYAYIQQAFFDGKKQPSVKKFFGTTVKKKETEIPSTSSEAKKTYNVKRKEQGASDLVDLTDDDDDVIPATPPSDQIYKRESVKFKVRNASEDVSKKLPKTDVAELIDIIDGNMNKPKIANREESFLMEVDKLRRKSICSEVEAIRLSKVGESEKMDVSESVHNESATILSSPTAESKSTKRKITDYFQIKSSKSS